MAACWLPAWPLWAAGRQLQGVPGEGEGLRARAARAAILRAVSLINRLVQGAASIPDSGLGEGAGACVLCVHVRFPDYLCDPSGHALRLLSSGDDRTSQERNRVRSWQGAGSRRGPEWHLTQCNYYSHSYTALASVVSICTVWELWCHQVRPCGIGEVLGQEQLRPSGRAPDPSFLAL